MEGVILPLLRKHSPNGATPDRCSGHLSVAYYSFVDPERMKGWDGMVRGLVADGLPTFVVIQQLQVERRTGKVCRRKTGVPPPCHPTRALNHLPCKSHWGLTFHNEPLPPRIFAWTVSSEPVADPGIVGRGDDVSILSLTTHPLFAFSVPPCPCPSRPLSSPARYGGAL